MLAGVIISRLDKCRGNALSFERSGNNGVADVESSVLNAVGYMGCFTVLCEGKALLFGVVENVHSFHVYNA